MVSAHLREAWAALHTVYLPTHQLVPTQSMEETLQGRTYEDRAALRADIERNGIQEPILLLSPTDYRIQDGHQRFEIAKALGLTEVPVTYVFLT